MPDSASVNLSVKMTAGQATKTIHDLSSQLKALGKDVTAAKFSIGGMWDSMNPGRKASFAMGVGAAAASAITPIFEKTKFANPLNEAVKGATEFGKVLAPLGPYGVAAGVAIGGFSGAIKGFIKNSKEAKEALDKQRRAEELANRGLVDSSVEHEWKWKNATDEERANMQHDARLRMESYRYQLGRGATISDSEILDAANWDINLAREMLRVNAKQNGGKASDKLAPLARDAAYLDLDKAEQEANRRFGREIDLLDTVDKWKADKSNPVAPILLQKAEDALRQRNEFLKPFQDRWNQYDASLLDGPSESMNILLGRRRFDPRLDDLYEQLHAPKEEEEPIAVKLASPGRSGSIRTPQADALSAAGLGYTGNPMQETESLLREISANTRRMTKGAIPTVAA